MSRVGVVADGGSRGNPGIAAGGSAVIDLATGEVLAEIGVYVGIATNNIAEYRGMIEGVRTALELHPDAELVIRMDSRLVVEQMSGRWKVKHPGMQELHREARELLSGTKAVFEWVPREQNKLADRLANEAMDQQASFRRLS